MYIKYTNITERSSAAITDIAQILKGTVMQILKKH